MAEGTAIQKVQHQEHVDNFFSTTLQGAVHKEFVPERKTVNAEFYIAVMDSLLDRIQGVRPVAFCSRGFFPSCTIMPPPTKLQVFVNI